MHLIGKIDKNLYKCITGDIRTEEVIITDERIEHIKSRHPGDYERYYKYIPNIISDPDYIIRDERPNTAMVLKEIVEDNTGEHFRLSLKLVTSVDSVDYKNSILSFMYVHKKEYERIVKNKEILYKKE